MERSVTRRSIFAQAWPIMLGQSLIPLVGIVDATVIGRTGNTAALAGVALGATVINLIFWTFGFLRMGTTGLTSQAEGRGDRHEVQALLVRSIAIAFGIGLTLAVLQVPLRWAAFSLLEGGPQVSAEASAYVGARFYGAPAALSVYVITGWLFGLGRTRAALMLQLIMNLSNIALDLVLVWGFGLGAAGVGYGTAGAETIALLTGLAIAGRLLGPAALAEIRAMDRSRLFSLPVLRPLVAINANLMVRTIALLVLFTWFANAGARLGAVPLAANHVLMQFVTVAAFVLDAFAFTAEARIGQAIGANSRDQMLRAIRLTGEFSLLGGLVIAALFWFSGDWVIAFITTDPAVRATAEYFLPFVVMIPVIGMPSWLLDGIFIGATRGKTLRNAALISTVAYLALDIGLRAFGNLGVWIALTLSFVFRAVALGWSLPGLMQSVVPHSALAGKDKAR